MNEKGQSLIEFVMLVPLFFIVMSGVNLYLNQEIKSLTEDSAYDALLISDAEFDTEERIIAQWNAAQLQSHEYNHQIINHTLNSSQYFKHSVDMKDQVFFDKNRVLSNTNSDCSQNPFYKLNFSDQGKFKFQTCTNKNGFEKTSFSYEKIHEEFKITKKNFEGKSIYYPNDAFTWKRRPFIALSAIQIFQNTQTESAFRTLYASLDLPVDHGKFNQTCLMNPSTPECSMPGLSGKWRRAAFDGANTQVLECFAEASAQCLKLIAPAAIGGCVVERTAEIATALAAGEKARTCPILNRLTEAIYNQVLFTTKEYQAKTLIQESLKREKKLTFKPNFLTYNEISY